MSSILADLDVMALPDKEHLSEHLDKFDLVFYDINVKLLASQVFPDHYVPYTMARRADLARLPETRLEQQPELLKKIWRHDRVVYDRSTKDKVTTDIIWFYQQLGLSTSALRPFLSTQFQEQYPLDPDSKIVLLHPFSSHTNKNWRSSMYIELANQLHHDGWNPVFTVAPYEVSEIRKALKRADSPHEVIAFDSLLEVSQSYRSARVLIGNDSGNGHLASFLGIPTITLLNGRRPRYRWRPSWAPNILIWGMLPQKLVKDRWSDFLSVNRVYRAFRKVVR